MMNNVKYTQSLPGYKKTLRELEKEELWSTIEMLIKKVKVFILVPEFDSVYTSIDEVLKKYITLGHIPHSINSFSKGNLVNLAYDVSLLYANIEDVTNGYLNKTEDELLYEIGKAVIQNKEQDEQTDE